MEPKQHWQSQTIALTGSCGSGKSTVSNLLAEQGAAVISADELAHRAVASGSPGLVSTIQYFGTEYLLPSGELDRKKLAALVFSDPTALSTLNAIVHPIVGALAAAEFESIRKRHGDNPIVVYDCPMFFEAGLDKQGFKSIIVVTAPESECLTRGAIRDRITPQEAKKRFDSQLPISEKVARADYVIDNSGSFSLLKEQVDSLWKRLK